MSIITAAWLLVYQVAQLQNPAARFPESYLGW